MNNQVIAECPKCHSTDVFKCKTNGFCRCCKHKSDYENFTVAGVNAASWGKEYSKHDHYERINN